MRNAERRELFTRKLYTNTTRYHHAGGGGVVGVGLNRAAEDIVTFSSANAPQDQEPPS